MDPRTLPLGTGPRRLLSLLLCVLLPCLGAACAADGAPPGGEPGEMHALVTRDGSLQLSWRSVPAPIPVGEEFEIEVTLTRTRAPHAPITGAQIFVTGTMPAHGHGMVREPSSVEVGEGRYRIPGVLLHMPGHWDMILSVVREDIAYAADFPLDL